MYQYQTIQYHQNKLFKTNQSKLYSELNVNNNSINESPDPEEATKPWKDIWVTPTDHNRNAKWLREVKNKLKDLEKQGKISISLEDVKHEIRRMASWKAPGPDGVHGFWYKKLLKFMEGLLLNFRNIGKWYSARMANNRQNRTHHERC